MIVRAVGYAGGETCLAEVGSRCGPLDVIAICGSSSCSLLPQAPIAMDRGYTALPSPLWRIEMPLWVQTSFPPLKSCMWYSVTAKRKVTDRVVLMKAWMSKGGQVDSGGVGVIFVPVEIGVKLMKLQSLCVYGDCRGSVVTACWNIASKGWMVPLVPRNRSVRVRVGSRTNACRFREYLLDSVVQDRDSWRLLVGPTVWNGFEMCGITWPVAWDHVNPVALVAGNQKPEAG